MLLAHLLTTVAKLSGPGGAKAIVVMDHFTHRVIGFGVHAGDVDGIALCRMFNTARHPEVLRITSALVTTRSSCITNG